MAQEKENKKMKAKAKAAREPKEAPKPEEKKAEEVEKAPEPKAGRTDELGKWYLDEVDFLNWANSVLRMGNLNLHASELRTKLENLRLTYEAERRKFLNQADAFERAAKKRKDEDHAKMMEKMGEKYGVDFKNSNIVLDDETGEIKLIDPIKGWA